jgi:mxaJ protein
MFPMSMAVRAGDQALKKRLDDVLEKHRAEIESVLRRNGVALFPS